MGAPCTPYLVVSGKAEVAVVPETFNVDLGRGEMRNKTNDAESGIKHATHPLHRLVQKNPVVQIDLNSRTQSMFTLFYSKRIMSV